jgi:hypothetical protein
MEAPPPGDATLALRGQRRDTERVRARRRRFGSLCFLAAGGAFGSALYLLRTRAERMLDGAHLPILVGLVATMAALFLLGVSAEQEVARLEDELAAIDEEIVRLLNRRN